ncbi:flagellar hook-length control protein FliK [Haematobacter genomosp. 1]|nr:flagellar hook-length control protein FliK [Haematobacter genomosp. 1]
MDAIALLSNVAPTTDAGLAPAACEFLVGPAFEDELEAGPANSKEPEPGPRTLMPSPLIPFSVRLEAEAPNSTKLDGTYRVMPVFPDSAVLQDIQPEAVEIEDIRSEALPSPFETGMEGPVQSDEERKNPPQLSEQTGADSATAAFALPGISSAAAETRTMPEIRPASKELSEGFSYEQPHFRQSGNAPGSIESTPPAIVRQSTESQDIGPPAAKSLTPDMHNRMDIAERGPPSREINPPEIAAAVPPRPSGQPMGAEGRADTLPPDKMASQAAAGASPLYTGKVDFEPGGDATEPENQGRGAGPDSRGEAVVVLDREAVETPALRESGRAERHSEGVNEARPRFFSPPAPVAEEAHRLFLRQDGEAMELSLDDKDLGRLDLKIHETPSGIRVEVDSSRADSLDAAKRQAAELQRDLRQQGYGEVSFHFGGEKRQDRRNQLRSETVETQFAVTIEAVPRKGLAGEDRLDLRM